MNTAIDTATNTATISSPAATGHGRPLQRFFRVVAEGQSYRNLAYLLCGLALGTVWFSVLVTGIAVGVSMLVVALLGVPILLGMGYVTRALANVERATTNALLGTSMRLAPWGHAGAGNPWRRLGDLGSDRRRRRELGFLLLRFPIAVAGFTAAVTALATPLTIAYAPFAARFDGDEPFGDWALSERLDEVSSSPWAWGLVLLGALLLVAAVHLVNAIAQASGRWTVRSLG